MSREATRVRVSRLTCNDQGRPVPRTSLPDPLSSSGLSLPSMLMLALPCHLAPPESLGLTPPTTPPPAPSPRLPPTGYLHFLHVFVST